MSAEQIDAAATAIRDAVRISIRPNGGTMELLEKGHTFHLNQEEATKAAKAAHEAFHPIITTAEELVALAEGAVILDADGDVSQRRGGEWCGYETAALSDVRVRKYLPATVLHMGGAS